VYRPGGKGYEAVFGAFLPGPGLHVWRGLKAPRVLQARQGPQDLSWQPDRYAHSPETRRRTHCGRNQLPGFDGCLVIRWSLQLAVLPVQDQERARTPALR
jgi:hypothetical protein